MRDFLQKRLQKNRAPPLVHSWEFYHDRQARPSSTGTTGTPKPNLPTTNGTTQPTAPSTPALHRPPRAPRHHTDVRDFWAVFNNFDPGALTLRDSLHLFHRGIQPLWEDPRNRRGGRWTFRIPRAHAHAAWTEVALLAIGEALQAAVEDPARTTFRDDICGVSLSVRFGSVLVQVWNRDAGNEAGVRRVREVVMEGLSAEYRPRGEGGVYYKPHFEQGARELEGEGKGKSGGEGKSEGGAV